MKFSLGSEIVRLHGGVESVLTTNRHKWETRDGFERELAQLPLDAIFSCFSRISWLLFPIKGKVLKNKTLRRERLGVRI